jgi:hypothetical protein
MTPTGSFRFGSPLESPDHRCRQLHRHEQVGRVHVVLAGFVDDADLAFATRFAIGQDLVNLAGLEVLHAAVFHTQRERTGCLLNSHCRQSRKRLIFRPFLPTP